MSGVGLADGVHVVESGPEDGPVLLCLHGIGSSSASFAQLAEDLGDSVRVVRWDAPGYAASSDPGRAPGLDGYADAAAELIRRRGGRAHVLGVSWGGVIALRLAVRHPELVASLIVADSSVGSGAQADAAQRMRARPADLERLGAAAFAAARGPRLVSEQAPPELVERVVRTMADSIRLPGYGYAAQAMAEADLTHELPQITAPVLVVCGAEDRVTGPAASQVITAGLPRAAYVVIADAGHLANQEQPDAFHAWVRAHLHVTARVPA